MFLAPYTTACKLSLMSSTINQPAGIQTTGMIRLASHVNKLCGRCAHLLPCMCRHDCTCLCVKSDAIYKFSCTFTGSQQAATCRCVNRCLRRSCRHHNGCQQAGSIQQLTQPRSLFTHGKLLCAGLDCSRYQPVLHLRRWTGLRQEGYRDLDSLLQASTSTLVHVSTSTLLTVCAYLIRTARRPANMLPVQQFCQGIGSFHEHSKPPTSPDVCAFVPSAYIS